MAVDGDDVGAAPSVAFVGLWESNAVLALSITDALETLCSESLGGTLPPRSIIAAQLDAAAPPHVLVGMGDGTLIAFRLDMSSATVRLVEPRRVVLGRTPVALTPFAGAAGVTHVFAACDRPTVIFAAPPRPGRVSSGKLVYANVDAAHAPSIVAVAALPSVAAPASAGAGGAGAGAGSAMLASAQPARLVLASPDALVIGSIDAVQRLHVQATPLGEQPRRVEHSRASRAIIVATEGPRLSPSTSAGATAEAVEAGALRIFDDTTFAPLGAAFELDPHEVAASLAVVPLGSEPVIVVGTVYMLDDEEEPSRGRILVLTVRGAGDARELSLQASLEVSGSVNALASLVAAPGASERLVATVNSKVVVFEWAAASEGSAAQLTPVASYLGAILSLYLDTAADVILVGDLMRSVTLLRFVVTPERGATLDEIAAEPSNHWMTSVALLDGGATALGAEHLFNIFTFARATDIAAAAALDGAPPAAWTGSTFGDEDDDATRLDVTGEFHTGEFINRFRPASLVMLPREATPDDAAALAPQMPPPSPMAAKRARTNEDGTARAGLARAAVSAPTPRLVFATVSGAVGVLLALPPELWATLARVQVALGRALPSAGGLSHANWRALYKDGRVLQEEPNPAPVGILDGDLLELILDLPREAAVAVVGAANEAAPPGESLSSVDEVCRAIEDLAALH
jgi:DNA damage-binding protein 1